MFKNYLKIAVRTLYRNSVFSIINIFGLAFGLCCALLIFLWANDEYNVDKHHSKSNQIYWVISEINSAATTLYWKTSPGPLAEILYDEVPGVKRVARITQNRTLLLKSDSLNFKENGIAADPEILSIFDFPLIQGDASLVLNKSNNIVISEELAKKLFPRVNPLNQIIHVDDLGSEQPFIVSGVLANIPARSSIQFDYIIPFSAYAKARPFIRDWNNYNFKTIALLDKTAKVSAIAKRINTAVQKHYDIEANKFHLYPFSDVYLKSQFSEGLNAEGRIVYVRIFLVVAFIIILIACINFMNLATARAGKRAKEIGIRKVSGANRKALIFQFLCEAIVISFLSGVVALIGVKALLEPFNELSNKSIQLDLYNIDFIIGLFSLCILTGLFAGAYPAFFLSAYNPIKILKSATSQGQSLAGLRRFLVIFQFSLSIIFIVLSIIVHDQLHFIINKELGIHKEQVIYHDIHSIKKNGDAYRNELLQINGVIEMTSANSNPLNIRNTTHSVKWQGLQEGDEQPFHVIQTDNHFIQTFKLNILEGRGFKNNFDSTSLEVIINETAAQVIGVNKDVLGSRITFWGYDAEVVGIVEDFNHHNLLFPVEPVVIFFNPEKTWRYFISISGNNEQIVSQIKKAYVEYESEYPFDYHYLDQDYKKMYADVAVIGRLSNGFALIAIIISCMGLFGLASFMTEQRKKEIGVRKTFGASTIGLVKLLSENFLSLVLYSLIIGFPVAWLLSQRWLTDFTFKAQMTIWPFVIGGIVSVIVALVTVSYHTTRAALTNPVDMLRHE